MAWSRLQSVANNSATTSVSVTTTSNCTSGSKLIAFIASGTNSGDQVTSVADGSSNAFSKLVSVGLAGTGNGHLDIWALDTPAVDVGTKPTITANVTNNAGNTVAILLQEVSGLLAGTSVLDGTWGTLTGTGGTSTGSPTYSSTAANEYLVTIYGDNGGPATYTGPTSPWTVDSSGVNSNANDDIALAYKNSSGGAETGGGWSLTSSGQQWAVGMVAFKLAGSAPVPSGLLMAL